MIYYTGDPHGSKYEITRFCNRMGLTVEDTIIILGDVGTNYYGDERDNELKKAFHRLKPTIFCIHGNHEMQPSTISYKATDWYGGQVWYEEEYPNLLFAKGGNIFTIEGLRHLVIGGAYSVDKYYRLTRGFRWWPDEQPSDEIEAQLEYKAWMCGYWHINKRIDKMHFLFHDFEAASQLYPKRVQDVPPRNLL